MKEFVRNRGILAGVWLALVVTALVTVLGFDVNAGGKKFSLKQVPAYSGSPYVEVHGNKP